MATTKNVIRYPYPEGTPESTEDATRYGSPSAADQKGTLTAMNSTFGFDEQGKIFRLPAGFSGPSGTGLPAAKPEPEAETPKKESMYDKTAREMITGLDRDINDTDRAAIREEVRRQAQDRIDAINAVYETEFAEAALRGSDRLGQQRSITARRGTLGSDFGEAQKEKVKDFNEQEVAAINARKAAEISSVLTGVQNRADALIRAKEEEVRGNAQAYLSYLKGVETDAREDVLNLAKGGAALEELDKATLDQLLEETGYDDFQLKMIWNANTPKDKIDWQSKVENGQLIVWGVDPKTGEPTMQVKPIEGAKQDGNYKPQVMPDGTLLFLPEKMDPTKSIDEQVIRYGSQGQFRRVTGGSGSGTDKKTEQEIKDTVAEVQAQLDNFALDKAAGRDVPDWAEALIAPERKRNSDTGEMEETGKYEAKKVTKGQIDTIRQAEKDSAAAAAQAELDDVDGVAASILDDLLNDVSSYEIRQAALAAGVKDSVFNEAMKKAAAQFYNSEAIGAKPKG